MAANTQAGNSNVAPWAINNDSSLLTTTTHYLPDGSVVRVSALYMIKQESPSLKSVVGEAIDRWLSKTEHCLLLFDGIKPLGDGFYVVTLLNMHGSPLMTFTAECTSDGSSSTLVPSEERKVKDLSDVFATGEHLRLTLHGSNSKGPGDPSFSILFAGSPGFGPLRQKLLEKVEAFADRADVSAVDGRAQGPNTPAHEGLSGGQSHGFFGWLKKLTARSPGSATVADELDALALNLIVPGYRRLAKEHGCAPSTKTSDVAIIELYKKVGTAFRTVAIERGEQLPAEIINLIVWKFLQISEQLGPEGLDSHLRYEVKKYSEEGLRSDYRQHLSLF